jgi:hypothetical protein
MTHRIRQAQMESVLRLGLFAEREQLQAATESVKVRLAFLESAWPAIDAALASLCEIRFDAQRQRQSQPQKQQFLSSSTIARSSSKSTASGYGG